MEAQTDVRGRGAAEYAAHVRRPAQPRPAPEAALEARRRQLKVSADVQAAIATACGCDRGATQACRWWGE